MVIRSHENSFGAWAFLIGVILAVIIGVGTSSFLSINSIKAYRTNTLGLDVDESGLRKTLDILRKDLAYIEELLGEN